MPQKEIISGGEGGSAWAARVEPMEEHRYLLDEVVLVASGRRDTVGLVFSTIEHLRWYAQEVAESIASTRPRSSDE